MRRWEGRAGAAAIKAAMAVVEGGGSGDQWSVSSLQKIGATRTEEWNTSEGVTHVRTGGTRLFEFCAREQRSQLRGGARKLRRTKSSSGINLSYMDTSTAVRKTNKSTYSVP